MKYNSLKQCVVLAAVAAFSVSVMNGAQATAIYSYTGATYTSISPEQAGVPGQYDTSMSISGSFTVAAPLAASAGLVDISGDLIDFSFSEGRNPALTLANTGNLFAFRVRVDGTGDIVDWDIVLQPKSFADTLTNEIGYTVQTGRFSDLAVTFLCTFNGGAGCISSRSELAQPPTSSGTWSRNSVAVPEPATVGLFGLGLLGLGAARRRRNGNKTTA